MLHYLKVLQAHALDYAGMVAQLAQIAMRVTMERIDAELNVPFFGLRSERAG